MIRTVIVFATAVALSATSLVAVAAFDGQHGPWQEGGGGNGIFTNTNNPDLRFDTNTDRKAVPGRAAAAQEENKADENSVVSRAWSTLVDPHRTLE